MLLGNAVDRTCSGHAAFAVVVCPTVSQILFHLCDRLRDGVGIMGCLECKYPALISLAIIFWKATRKGGLNDLVHGLKFR